MTTYKNRLFYFHCLLLLSFLPTGVSLSLTTRVSTRTRASAINTALPYKTTSRDGIAHEILALEGDNAHRSNSHDQNPWKEYLKRSSKNKKHPESAETLIKDAGTHTKEVTVESLQKDLYSLYQIAQQLTESELQVAGELIELQKERNSIRKLARRIVVLTKERIVSRFQKLFGRDKKNEESN
jgi:hypothetical protein